MQLQSLALLIAASLSLSKAQNPSVKTQQSCYTAIGTNKVQPVPTNTQAATFALTFPVFVRATATSTVTPAPVVTTVVSTVTSTTTVTDTANTDTFTVTSTPVVTSTVTETDTETETSTSAVFTTTTVSSGTTTLPPGPYFTPVSKQVTDMGRSYSRRSVMKEQEPAAHAGSLLARTVKRAASSAANRANQLCNKGKKTYTQQVKCKKLVQQYSFKTYTLPSNKKTTVTAVPAISTSTSTTTMTSTSTVAPPGVTLTTTSTAPISTSTVSTTVATTTTVTTIATQTETVQLPQATDYAACQSNNIVNRVDNLAVTQAYANAYPDTGFTNAPAASAKECCNRCQDAALADSTTCRVFFYDSGPNQEGCYLGYDYTNTGPTTPYTIGLAVSDYGPYIMGNGPGGVLDTIFTS